LQQLDDAVLNMRLRPWKAVLPFCVDHVTMGDDASPVGTFVELDLFSLVDCIYQGTIARFNPLHYPVVAGGMKANSNVWGQLRSDLIASSKKHGCQLTSNGSHGKADRVALRCSRFRFYPESKRRLKDDCVYRQHTINCDKANARKATGNALPRKTSTSRPVKVKEESTCKVKLVIGVDATSFFLVCGYGERTHEGHPPLGDGEMPTRRSTVPNEAIVMAKQLATKGTRPGAICGVLNDIYGVELSKRQVAQTTQMAKLAKDLIGADYLETNKDTMSDLDRVKVHLKSIGASYVALYHRKGDCDAELGERKKRKPNGGSATVVVGNESVLIVDSVDSSGEVTSTRVEQQDPGGKSDCDHQDLFNYAADTRKVVGASDDQDVLVALVWVTLEGQRFFLAFPEQLSVDGTHKTNDEGWELVTLSIQDMNGKQEVVIRCWAPNNRAWLFRWLFQTAIPSLIGREACGRVRLVITDGDSQECEQMDAAIDTVFTGAKRRRCGWHIVDRGMVRKVGSFRGKDDKKRNEIDALMKVIKGWLYSHMKDVETVTEYKL
jgi:hypothetical protein